MAYENMGKASMPLPTMSGHSYRLIEGEVDDSEITDLNARGLQDATEMSIIYTLPVIDKYHDIDETTARIGIVLDVETTGKLEELVDDTPTRCTEICALPFAYDPATGKIGHVFKPYLSTQDPGQTISPLITRMTGHTNESLRGSRFDTEGITQILRRASICVAHNASFDRNMMEREFGRSIDETQWLCSLNDINWDAKFDASNRKLNYLTYMHGFKFDHHKAENDCRATLHLIAHGDSPDRPYLLELLEKAKGLEQNGMVRFVINFSGHPNFHGVKDKAKNYGFRYNPNNKTWWMIACEGMEADTIRDFMRSEIYQGGDGWTETQVPVEKLHQIYPPVV